MKYQEIKKYDRFQRGDDELIEAKYKISLLLEMLKLF
jgi:hypothetical protein